MNKKVTVGAVGAAAMLAAGAQSAHAQVYKDLRGALMGFTGTAYVNTTVSALGGVISTAIATSLTLGPGGSAPGQLVTFNSSGPANDSDLTGLFPLPIIKITSGISLTLPTLTLSGNFNENTGAFNMKAFASTGSTPPIPVSLSGINLTLTATYTNPSATFVGAAVPGSGVTDQLSITNSGMTASVWINPYVNSSLGQVSLNNLQLYFTSWTLTAVPGPDSLAVFLPGMIGGLALLRRRRRSDRK
jgi:hypothetical protein